MKLSNKMSAEVSEVDVLLLPFLEASTAQEEEDRLTSLLTEHISPLIKQILRHKLSIHPGQKSANNGHQDLEEVSHEIQLHLLSRLYDLKHQPINKPVVNLRSYVAVAARNACDEYLRRKFPQRRNLKDHIRYYLLSHEELALWKDQSRGWLCGLSVWNGDNALAHLNTDAQSKIGLLDLVSEKLQNVDVSAMSLDRLITTILEIAGRPVEFDQLTSIIARSYGVEDHPATSFDNGGALLSERLASPQANADEVIEYRQYLAHLWGEICQLPRAQRVALLCNLRNQQGINVITLFPATRVASFEQIAEALEIKPTEFETLWSELPLDDLRLAKYLGISRQQVINLRRNARDRLMRRMKNLESRSGRKT